MFTISDPAGYVEAELESEPDLDTVSKKQLSDDYADILKTVCQICSKTVETETFRCVENISMFNKWELHPWQVLRELR